MKYPLIIWLLCSIGVAQAQTNESSFYVGGGYTSTNYSISSSASDNTDGGFKFFFGERINKSFAGELQYSNIGFSDQTSEAHELQAQSIGYSLLLSSPKEYKVNPFFKIGLHYWDADFRDTAATQISDDGMDIFFGLGLNIKTDNNWAIRTEYERFRFDRDSDSATADALSFSMSHTF